MKYTDEELKVLNDKEYDAIGEQLGVSLWLWATMLGGLAIFFIACIWWVAKCLGVFIEWLI